MPVCVLCVCKCVSVCVLRVCVFMCVCDSAILLDCVKFFLCVSALTFSTLKTPKLYFGSNWPFLIS